MLLGALEDLAHRVTLSIVSGTAALGVWHKYSAALRALNVAETLCFDFHLVFCETIWICTVAHCSRHAHTVHMYGMERVARTFARLLLKTAIKISVQKNC